MHEIHETLSANNDRGSIRTRRGITKRAESNAVDGFKNRILRRVDEAPLSSPLPAFRTLLSASFFSTVRSWRLQQSGPGEGIVVVVAAS